MIFPAALFALIAFLLLAAGPRSARAQSSSASAAITIEERVDCPDGILLFRPGQRATLRYHLKNAAAEPVPVNYRFTLTDADGRERGRGAGALSVPAGGSSAPVPFALNTAGLRYGVYYLRLRVEQGGNGPVVLRESYLGVCSPARLRKAGPGEFLYGLDVQFGDPDENSPLWRWMEAMGVDITRGGVGWEADPAYVARRLPLYDARNLRVLITVDPPKDQDLARRGERLAARVRAIEEIARAHRQLTYWEMGNEPDLLGFYGGPIENYAADLEAMYAAVKRGNKNTVVMNGGLSFAGDEGMRRSHRFVEVMNPRFVDAWAYHGHGPGAQAERSAFERMRQSAREFGKAAKPLIETESGVAARPGSRAQERMQARTAVQKLVYAQSERMPLFIWFRLLMFEEDYGNLRTVQEPRPAVLSYRALVETLRGHTFKRMIDLGAGRGVEAYLFAEPGGPGRVCVLWGDGPAARSVNLSLASRAGRARSLQTRDLFGNPTPLAPRAGDGPVVASVAVNHDPVFVVWNTTEPNFVVSRALALAAPPAPTLQLVRGAENPLVVTVRNPFAHRAATLSVAARPGAAVPARVSPATQTVRLGPGAARRVPFTLRLREGSDDGLIWPAAWTIFPNVDEKRIDLSRLASLPDALPGTAGTLVQGRRLFAGSGGRLMDFDKLGTRAGERTPALALAEIISDRDQSVTVGASADWWMAWYVNGRPVFDTLATGNGAGYTLLDHVFRLPLRKGRNFVAVRVLSGSQGWKFLVGDPQSVRRARGGPSGASQITLSVREANTTLAREFVDVFFTAPVAPLDPGLTFDSPAADWRQQEPTTLLDAASVQNLWFAQPDASRWWKGEADLSGSVTLRRDARNVYLFAAVRDDRHAPAGAKPDTGDAVEIFLSTGERAAAVSTYTIRQTANGQAVVTGGPGSAVIRARVERQEPGMTYYRVALPQTLTKREFFVNLRVRDSDEPGVLKQFADWKPGLNASAPEPARWFRAALIEARKRP